MFNVLRKQFIVFYPSAFLFLQNFHFIINISLNVLCACSFSSVVLSPLVLSLTLLLSIDYIGNACAFWALCKLIFQTYCCFIFLTSYYCYQYYYSYFDLVDSFVASFFVLVNFLEVFCLWGISIEFQGIRRTLC